jgi:hypothetical protein
VNEMYFSKLMVPGGFKDLFYDDRGSQTKVNQSASESISGALSN